MGTVEQKVVMKNLKMYPVLYKKMEKFLHSIISWAPVFNMYNTVRYCYKTEQFQRIAQNMLEIGNR